MKTVLRKRLVLAGLAATALIGTVACDGVLGPGEVASGTCIAVVIVDGVQYVAFGGAGPDFTPGEHVATVSGYRECQDMITVDENGEPDPPIERLQDGESNFLPAGTKLYAAPGYPTTERLAARTEEGWTIVAVQHEIDRFQEGGLDVWLYLDAGAVIPPARVTARLIYVNLRDTTVTVTSEMGCRALVGVYGGETRVSFPTTDYTCPAAVTSWPLEAGHSLQDEWVLDIGSDGTPLEPGHYRFVAELLTHDRVLELPFEVLQ